jgi:enoyl-CoA hydratase
MAKNSIVFETEDSVATIRMNRPEVLNALDENTVRQLRRIIECIRRDNRLRVVVITGTGKAFVAGADIKWMKNKGALRIREFLQLGQETFKAIESLEKPVIAAVNGYALGGGCELALACDIRIASDNARFGQPEINFGIMPGWGATQRLARSIGACRTKEMILLGDTIDAVEAERIGLINKVVSSEKLYPVTKELACKLTTKPPVAIRLAKAAINKASETNLNTGLEYEAELCSMLFTTKDQKEGMAAFIQKRKPSFRGR